jgi:hypothetical protein
MAFLPVVLFNNTIYGWSDIFCYSFLLLALMNPEYCFFGIFFGILSHELFFVYLPFIVLYYLRFHPNFFKDDDRLIRVGLCLLVMFLLYTLIRLWITSHHTTAWTVQHYVSLLPKRGFFYELKSQPLLAGFFSSYEMSFILIFPFLYFLIRNVKRKVLDILLLLSALFPALLLFVVHDTTRFWSITFIFILLFPFYLNRMRNRLLVIILIGNLLIPTFYFGSDWRAPLDRQADFIFSKVTARKNGEKDFAKAIYDFNIPSLIKQMLDP